MPKSGNLSLGLISRKNNTILHHNYRQNYMVHGPINNFLLVEAFPLKHESFRCLLQNQQKLTVPKKFEISKFVLNYGLEYSYQDPTQQSTTVRRVSIESIVTFVFCVSNWIGRNCQKTQLVLIFGIFRKEPLPERLGDQMVYIHEGSNQQRVVCRSIVIQVFSDSPKPKIPTYVTNIHFRSNQTHFSHRNRLDYIHQAPFSSSRPIEVFSKKSTTIQLSL